MNINLSAPQHIYLKQLTTKFKAYVGGYGSGKTFIACIGLIYFAMNYRGHRQAYFGPSYPAIRDIFYPTMEEAAALFGLTTKVHYANKEVDLFHAGNWIGTIICRSMDHPETIVGFKVVHGVADELDVLKADKAAIAWKNMVSRIRYTVDGVLNTLGVTTTPEGFNFVYEKFAKKPKAKYSMVQASSYENKKYLPPDYIESMLEDYPEHLARAYINGEFVNLKSGSVYSNFDRNKNQTTRVHDGKEPIYVGMDFNVGKMAAIVHVIDDDGPRAVDEIINAYDTPDMINIIKNRYPNITTRIYPDASGGSRKSVNASVTDLALLQNAGFTVVADKSNPPVKDRINAMQKMLCDNEGKRRYLVNINKCPTLADNLEQQVWNQNGEPDKSANKDHTNDAAGYFIQKKYPIIKPVTRFKVNFAY